jgi:hypothetical protein
MMKHPPLPQPPRPNFHRPSDFHKYSPV